MEAIRIASETLASGCHVPRWSRELRRHCLNDVALDHRLGIDPRGLGSALRECVHLSKVELTGKVENAIGVGADLERTGLSSR
jgi:hypothetical protein